MRFCLSILTANRAELGKQSWGDSKIRGEDYFARMMESLEAAGTLDCKELQPITVVVGTPTTDHMGAYQRDRRLRIVALSKENAEKADLPNRRPVQRCAMNYLQCWRDFQSRLDHEWLVVLEDDVLVAKGWIEYLNQVMDEVLPQCEYAPLFTLYRPVDRLMKRMYEKSKVKWFDIANPMRHWGMQGMAYHQGHFDPVLFKAVRDGVVNNPKTPVEILEQVLFKHLEMDKPVEKREKNIRFIATNPSLVQHIGQQSAIGCAQHQALLFLGDLSDAKK